MPHTGADKTEAVYPGFWNTLATGFLIGIGSIAPGGQRRRDRGGV